MLQKIDIKAATVTFADWIREQCPGTHAVALDGKAMRGSHDHKFAAVGNPRMKTATTVAILDQHRHAKKTRHAEVVAALHVIRWLALGRFVLANKLHTNRSSGVACRTQKPGYVFRVNSNQQTLFDQLQQRDRCKQAAQSIDRGRTGIKTRHLVRTDTTD